MHLPQSLRYVSPLASQVNPESSIPVSSAVTTGVVAGDLEGDGTGTSFSVLGNGGAGVSIFRVPGLYTVGLALAPGAGSTHVGHGRQKGIHTVSGVEGFSPPEMKDLLTGT